MDHLGHKVLHDLFSFLLWNEITFLLLGRLGALIGVLRSEVLLELLSVKGFANGEEHGVLV